MNLQGGIWHNEYGYTRVDTGDWDCGNPVFKFKLDPFAPMTLQLEKGYFVQPDRRGKSNGGNIPWFLRWFINEHLHNPSWIIHDCACADKQHRLYFSDSANGPFIERRVDSQEAAKIMGVGLYAAGHTKKAYWAYHGVKRFGPKF